MFPSSSLLTSSPAHSRTIAAPFSPCLVEDASLTADAFPSPTAVANETSADEERERLKRKLLKQAMSFFNPPIPAKLKSTASNIQFLIGAATDIAPPVCDSDLDSDSDSDDEDHDYDGDGGRPDEDGLGEDEKGEGSRGKDIDCDKEAMAEAEAERRRLNVKRKAATKRFREMHARPKMTTSERVRISLYRQLRCSLADSVAHRSSR